MSTSIDARNPVWPTAFLPISGVAYVATGARFLAEALNAATQLRKTNPDVPICVITDQQIPASGVWNHIVKVNNPHLGFRDKILMGLCPYEKFLYLDTDTYVTDSIQEIFLLLSRFDFAGHQLFEGHDCPLEGIPDAFPEFNGGVLAFRRSTATTNFFSQWLANYDRFYALNSSGNYHYSNASDQKALRLTVWESQISVAVLGPEFDFVPQHVEFACSSVRIIHGRLKDPEGLKRRLNARLGNRAYIPLLDVVLHHHIDSGEFMRLSKAIALQAVRRIGVTLTPRIFRDLLRRSTSVRKAFLGHHNGEVLSKNDPKWHAPEGPTP